MPLGRMLQCLVCPCQNENWVGAVCHMMEHGFNLKQAKVMTTIRMGEGRYEVNV